MRIVAREKSRNEAIQRGNLSGMVLSDKRHGSKGMSAPTPLQSTSLTILAGLKKKSGRHGEFSVQLDFRYRWKRRAR
jgi:hypothetical protein